MVVASGDSLHLSFPEVPSGTEVVRTGFRGTLYSTGGRLQALLRGSGDGLWQRVDEKVTRTSLQVVAHPERKELFRELAVNPPVFSPKWRWRQRRDDAGFHAHAGRCEHRGRS